MMTKTISIGLLALLSGCTAFLSGTYFSTGIRGYSGDGEIVDVSERGGFFSTKGYRVVLPRFAINRAYAHTFRLEGLPTMEDRPISIHFAVPSSLTRLAAAKSGASIEMLLTTTAGREVTRIKRPLDDLVWSGSSLYDRDHSFFHPSPGEQYRLEVKFSPGSGLNAAEGFVYLSCLCGGS